MDFEPLTALDGETFRRVWERVMPDQSLSPVVVRETTPPPSGEDYIGQLEGVIDGVHQWLCRLEVLSRQNGGRTALRTLAEGERRQLRRLDGLYFLLSGSRYTPRGKLWGSESSGDSLRRGFFLQLDWGAWYGGLQFPQSALQEATKELEEGTLEQCRLLRTLVEGGGRQRRG